MTQVTQTFDVTWSKDGLEVVQEVRLLGNNFYKCNQYRAAALLYRTGLGVIAPGSILPYFHGRNIAEDAPEEVAKQYLTLLINLAQALLNMPPRDMHRELAAMDASGVCGAAISHLHWALKKWHKINFADFVRHLQHTTCPPKLAYLGDLLAKAKSRKRIALERCGDISGALIDLSSTAVGKLPACVTEEDLLEEMLLGFESPESAVKIPKGATRIFSRPLECCHRAAVKFFDVPKVDVQLCATPLGEIATAFSCGNYREAAVFVMSYFRADNTNGRGYIMCNWRGTREQMALHTCASFMPSTHISFQSGAILGNVLYCVSLFPDCLELRGFFLLTSHDFSGSFQASLMSPTEVTLARRDTALVACCGALYVFGGCIQDSMEGSDRVASQDLIIFKPNLSKSSVYCSLVHTGKQRPAPRWGQATFVDGSFIYIFGGMCEIQGGSKTWDSYLNSMWRFDVKSRTWLRFAFFGCKPCPRAHMGVAFDERRATIVGGVTAKPDGGKVYLADVWEFDFESRCWIQVVPDIPSGGWISARSGAVCSLMDGDTLVIFAGVGPYGLVDRNEMVILTVERGSAAKLASKAGRSGQLHDRGLLRTCADVVRKKRHFAKLPDWIRSLYTAPAGSVILLASPPLHLVEGVFTPSHKSKEECKPFLPSDCIFSPEPIQPIRPLGGNAENVWGSTECPFDIPPRWLNVPREISVNLASASSAVQRLEEPVSIRQTVKQFGTVKAAVEYFKLCQPQVHLSGWQPIGGKIEITVALRWQLQECEAFAIDGLQDFKVSTYCHRCGKQDPPVALLDTESRPTTSTKVCRGCHLVRYCGSKCQREDWEGPFGHKAVCKKFASQLQERRQ